MKSPAIPMMPNKIIRSVLVQTFFPNWLTRKVEDIVAKTITETIVAPFSSFITPWSVPTPVNRFR